MAELAFGTCHIIGLSQICIGVCVCVWVCVCVLHACTWRPLSETGIIAAGGHDIRFRTVPNRSTESGRKQGLITLVYLHTGQPKLPQECCRFYSSPTVFCKVAAVCRRLVLSVAHRSYSCRAKVRVCVCAHVWACALF